MLENATKVILTLKKRPRHSNNFGQIYVKPYRLPSKKRESYNFRWNLQSEAAAAAAAAALQQQQNQLQVQQPQPVKIPEVEAVIPEIQPLPDTVPDVKVAPPPYADFLKFKLTFDWNLFSGWELSVLEL